MTPERVVRFLLARGLVSHADLVQRGLRIDEVVGRNRNFAAITPDRGFFIKHARPGESDHGVLLATEAAVYEAGTFGPLVPGFQCFDREEKLLVLDHVPPETEGGEPAAANGFGIAGLGSIVGQTLAECHMSSTVQPPPALAHVRRTPPWILRIGRPDPFVLQELSPAQAQVIGVLQERPQLLELLDGLRQAWAATTLVHGDLKWSNMLVDANAVPGERGRVKFVDWELISWGDPAWDVGSIFQSYLAHGVLHTDLEDDTGPVEAVSTFAEAIEAMRPEQRAFWGSYVTSAGIGTDAVPGLLERSISFAGARLLQSAFEWSAGESNMPRHATAVLQLCLNMFEKPGAVGPSLFGLAR